MSGGGDLITEASLFAFDDVFGDGTNCLQAGAVLRALSPNGEIWLSLSCLVRRRIAEAQALLV